MPLGIPPLAGRKRALEGHLRLEMLLSEPASDETPEVQASGTLAMALSHSEGRQKAIERPWCYWVSTDGRA